MKHLGKFNKLVQENFVNNDGFQRFYGISSATLNKHAPCKKKKQARGNQMSFFNKGILKAIMTRAKLHNIFLQNKSEENRKFKKQRNFSCLF